MGNHNYHISVMLNECIAALQLKPNGVYVDATFGGGGHSSEILKNIPNGKLIAFDQDDDAKANLPNNENLIFVNHNFRFLYRFLKYHQVIPVDGILADLGISSFQIDAAHKGFSTRFEGPLDMRMNQEGDLTAADILQQYSYDELLRILSEYGEVRNAKTLANALIQAKEKGMRFETTAALRAFLDKYSMGGNPNKYYAQVFQALRIEVNDELNALKEMLEQSYRVLKKGGILAIISFHSLEDRIVKNFMKTGNVDGKRVTDEFGVSQKYFKVLTKKPIEATAEEQKLNPRSRSAKLRIAQKI